MDGFPHGCGVRRINAPEEGDIALEVCAVEVAPRVDERKKLLHEVSFHGVDLRRDLLIVVCGAFDALDLFLFVLEPLSAGFDGHCLDESECGFEVLLLQAGVPRDAEMVLEGGVDHAEVLRCSGCSASDCFLDFALLGLVDVVGAALA